MSRSGRTRRAWPGDPYGVPSGSRKEVHRASEGVPHQAQGRHAGQGRGGRAGIRAERARGRRRHLVVPGVPGSGEAGLPAVRRALRRSGRLRRAYELAGLPRPDRRPVREHDRRVHRTRPRTGRRPVEAAALRRELSGSGQLSGVQLASVAVMTTGQAQRARAFANLHQAGAPLLLPNAWDVASAVAIAGAGAKAIATTSAGVASSLGVPDGASLGAKRAAAVVARIVAALDLPVSADIEAGYEDVAA